MKTQRQFLDVSFPSQPLKSNRTLNSSTKNKTDQRIKELDNGGIVKEEDKLYLDNSGILTGIVVDHNSARKRDKLHEATQSLTYTHQRTAE